MADIISYDISLDPSQPVVTLAATATASSITLEVVPPVNVTVKAKATTSTRVISGLLTLGLSEAILPVVGSKIGDTLTSKIQDAIKDNGTQTIDLGGPIGFNFDVDGIHVKVQAASLALSTFNSVLMADGTVAVS